MDFKESDVRAMMQGGQSYVYSFAAIVIFGFLGWYYTTPSLPTLVSQQERMHTPDSMMINLQVMRFDRQGRLVGQLQTPRLLHYAYQNTSRLENPHITLYRKTQAPWDIVAQKGKAVHGTRKVVLWEDVRLHKNRSTEDPESTITTARLVYYPEKQLAKTSERINFEQPGISLQSEGMQAYLDREQIDLLHTVKVRYLSQKEGHALT